MNNYSEKTAAYLRTFVEKEGYTLLKTEFVLEDGCYYLRAYIDLTDEERAKRKALMEQEAEEAADLAEEEEQPKEDQTDEEEQPEKEPGIGVNDCAKVSRRLSKWLDKEDFISEVYTLEVCSRGYLDENKEN